MPKPLILYRVEGQNGQAWLWLSSTKPDREQAGDLCGIDPGSVVLIETASREDAAALTPDADEFIGLIIPED